MLAPPAAGALCWFHARPRIIPAAMLLGFWSSSKETMGIAGVGHGFVYVRRCIGRLDRDGRLFGRSPNVFLFCGLWIVRGSKCVDPSTCHASRGNVVCRWGLIYEPMRLPVGNPSQFRECGGRVDPSSPGEVLQLGSETSRIGQNHMLAPFGTN